MREVNDASNGSTAALIIQGDSSLKVSHVIAMSVSSVLLLSMPTLSTELTLAQSIEVRLSAKMLSGPASGKADYRERGNRRRLNVEAENLSNSTPSPQTMFVNGAPVWNMILATCPIPATQLFCGELALNTQSGQSVPVITRGQIVSIGSNPSVLASVPR